LCCIDVNMLIFALTNIVTGHSSSREPFTQYT
jgi:hypothetical protein